VQVSVDFPGSPTDHAIVAVYITLDDSSEVWDLIPMMEFLIDGAEIEALAGSNPSFAAWEQNEPYRIPLLIKGRSGGASTKHLYRSGISSTADHVRHDAEPASRAQ
jgi:hypothetical protein